ncbi:Protein of unknown function (DUF1302) [Pseudomonas sp. GM21]|jgi:hypothetical protein|uniref:DUF1302 domain-containing protein n=1 Tax=Pseudomonas sp. GM21 TaxID=1144325 RepID=UPI00027259B4|nr:DUF1302 domain-containing protein [Pseudomonas sp. GM21]EJM15542.1 Protein of unknown function (DUF1302) [Pseudomonas sp. GM21]
MQIIKIRFAAPQDVLYRQSIRSVVVATSLLAAGSSLAAPIDVGNPDIKLRWDNTVKYSAGMRVENPDDKLIQFVPPTRTSGAGPAALNGDDGDRNFKSGRLISNRLDLLSEMDLVVHQDYGLRVSGAAWYDDVYNHKNDNNSPATNNSLSVPYNEFTDDTRDLHGRKAELLDAFVFGGADVGTARVSGRLGQHTVLWGESLFFGANAIAGTQSPVDVIKASSVPGSTTKEIIMPVGQFSGQIQFSPVLTVMGYYQYDWEKTRLPAAGSYFSVNDFIGEGGERIRVAPGVPGLGLSRGQDIKASDDGQFGLGLRSQLGDWEFGLYAIRFHAKTPVLYSHAGRTNVVGAGIGTYQWVYPEDIKAFGVSATTTVDTVNFAGELSVRRDTPLTSLPVEVGSKEADNNNHAFYAIGNTAHANVSMIWTMPRNFLSDEPSFSMEVAYNERTSCTSNCTAMDPGLDRHAEAVRGLFSIPQRNVMDGLDLTPSFTVGYNHGKSPVVIMGPNDGGDMTLTLAGNYLSVWDFSMAYTHYYGGENTATYSSIDPSVNGTFTFAQTLKDRDFVSASLRRTF